MKTGSPKEWLLLIALVTFITMTIAPGISILIYGPVTVYDEP